MINDFLSRIPGFKRDVIYDLLAYQNLNLCLDVGAAAGVITKCLKQIGTDDTRVIGFEPFVGNHQYFLKNTQSYQNIELVKKAAAATTGTSTFRVLSTVKGSEKGWEQYLGYSSTGCLVDEEASTEFQTRNPKMQELHVDTIAIDDLIDEHVDFMKIDVQGGEYGVLKGCERVITNHGIDVMYVEFDGDRRILEYLNSLGYTIFDTDYLLVVYSLDTAPLSEMGFYDFEILNLSVGRQAYRAKLSLSDENYCDFFEGFKAQKLGYAFTDLICVSKPFLKTFLENVLKYSAAQVPNSAQDSHSLAAVQRPVEKRIVMSSSTTVQQSSVSPQKEKPQQTKLQHQSNAPAPGATSSALRISDKTVNAKNNRADKKGQKRTGMTQQVRENRIGSEISSKSTSKKISLEEDNLSSKRATERGLMLIKRIASYYSRWPIGLALLVIIFDLVAYTDTSFRWVFAVLNSGVILLLIGHAASKADRLIVEIDTLKEQQIKLKEQQIKLENRVSRHQKRVRKKIKNNR